MSKLVLDLRLLHLTVGLHLQHLAADLLTEGLFVGGDVDWAREVVAEIEVAELAVAAVGLDLSKMGLAPRRPWRRTFATARTSRVKCGWREWRWLVGFELRSSTPLFSRYSWGGGKYVDAFLEVLSILSRKGWRNTTWMGP
jgi:hypothetical protein